MTEKEIIEKMEEEMEAIRSDSQRAVGLVAELKEAQEKSLSLQAVDTTRLNVQVSRSPSAIESHYELIERLRVEALEAWQKKLHNEKAIDVYLYQMSYNCRCCLWDYYCKGLRTWAAVADKNEVRERTIYRWKNAGLLELGRLKYGLTPA